MSLNILENTATTIFKKGDILIQQGQSCENFIFIKKGQIRVFARSEKGKEVTLYHIKPTELCVLTTSCLMSHDHFPAEAVAETDIEIVIINKQKFHKLLSSSDDFRQQIFNNFGSRLKELILKIETITSDSLAQRLSKFLLQHSENGFIYKTHNEIALDIGSLREAVSRALKSMENDGLIITHRGKIELLNTELLRQHR